MKNFSLFVAAAGIFLLQSCKEIGPNIDFGTDERIDTAYMAGVESPLVKKVLAEEFTGVSCPPCPDGHKTMASTKQQLNGNMVIIAYHIYNYPQANPVEKNGELLSHYDFRTEDATEVGKDIFGGIGGMPLAGFDRVEVAGSRTLNRSIWSGTAAQQAAVGSPVNIHLTSSFDNDTREATVIVRLAYTKQVDKKQNITLAVTEDSLVDAQKTLTDIEKEYVHEHTLRDIITPVYGTQIPDKVNPKEPGKVYERTFKFPVDTAWHEKHCHVIAFVTNDESGDRMVV
ncbi:MAG: Omp28-related outer membrane protein, partial [Chitinophagaceae bacterium]|nr:Omp28-related outer membrane protein [Chitinophagaceae bacterium]